MRYLILFFAISVVTFFSCNKDKGTIKIINKNLSEQIDDFIEYLPAAYYYKDVKEIVLYFEKDSLNENKFFIHLSNQKDPFEYCSKDIMGIYNRKGHKIYIQTNVGENLFFKVKKPFDCEGMEFYDIRKSYSEFFPKRYYFINKKGNIIDSLVDWQWMSKKEYKEHYGLSDD